MSGQSLVDTDEAILNATGVRSREHHGGAWRSQGTERGEGRAGFLTPSDQEAPPMAGTRLPDSDPRVMSNLTVLQAVFQGEKGYLSVKQSFSYRLLPEKTMLQRSQKEWV